MLYIQNFPELSVVVLGYRAGHRLKFFVKELVDFLEKEMIDYQLVLVGNYWPNSEDKTPEVVAELSKNNNRIKPVINPKQGRMGWDMHNGLNEADGKYIAIMDGDGQMPALDVIRVYKKIKTGDFDIVKTYREKRLDGLWRRMVSFFYNFIFAMLFPEIGAKDINSKPKVLTRDFLNKLDLTSDDWFADAEIMIQARRIHARIGEIPTVFNKNENRPSLVKFSAIFEFIKNLVIFRINEFKKTSKMRNNK